MSMNALGECLTVAYGIQPVWVYPRNKWLPRDQQPNVTPVNFKEILLILVLKV